MLSCKDSRPPRLEDLTGEHFKVISGETASGFVVAVHVTGGNNPLKLFTNDPVKVFMPPNH